MVKTLVTSQQDSQHEGTQAPVADEELEPEAMAEILRRVELMVNGEDTVLTNEEVLKGLSPEAQRLLGLLDELT